MASQPQLPLPPDPEPASPVPVAPPEPRRKRTELAGPSVRLTVLLCLAAALATTVVMLVASNRGTINVPTGSPVNLVRPAVAEHGTLIKSLRVGGTMETLNYAAIRAPRMRGPRDAGRAYLTIASMVPAGTVVQAGDTVAEFELRWLEDHITDRESVLVQARARHRKRDAQIRILKETERQARVSAKAEYDKAVLDLRTAEVRSVIEAEVLKNLSEEYKVIWEQLEAEGKLMDRVHAADLRGQELLVEEDRLHLERHVRDFERLQVKSPIDGMVVVESAFTDNKQFSQRKEGDRIYPGSLFMRIVDVNRPVLNASVNQVDAQSIRIGAQATVHVDAYPGVTFPGRVVDLGAVASSSSSTVGFGRGGNGAYVRGIPVRILLDESDERILPDLSASADVQLSGAQEGIIVPREAVRRKDGTAGRSVVHVITNGSVRERNVIVQDMNDTHALLSQGLSDGQEVLVSPATTTFETLQ